jgi:hypothetical protein
MDFEKNVQLYLVLIGCVRYYMFAMAINTKWNLWYCDVTYPLQSIVFIEFTCIQKTWFLEHYWCAPKLLDRLQWKFKIEIAEKSRVRACSLARNIFWGRGASWSSRMGLEKMTSIYSLTQICTKPSNELVSALRKHFWCYDEPQANSDWQDSPRPKLGGKHYLPPHTILCASPWSPHPNCQSWDSRDFGAP